MTCALSRPDCPLALATPGPEPKPDRLLTFAGAARKLDDIDLPRIAATIGCGEDHLHAVMDVETAGGGFDASGRPRALFEPHVFWRELGPGPKRDRAAREGLAYAAWGTKPYPRDSYGRIAAAMQIDRKAALRSTSWGLGQIMGFNASLAGYDSAEAMVLDFLDDEDRHLEAMVRFIVASGLDDELRRKDWTGFARGYNGSGYARHGYHIRLSDRFAWWAKRPDTPFKIARAEIDPNAPFAPRTAIA